MTTPIDSAALRAGLIETARAMNRRGINVNKSGNVSVRALSDEDGRAGFLITPTGIPYESLEPDDIVFVPFGGGAHRGRRRASSEWEMHERVLARRPDVSAVVHTHSAYATALACQRLRIPAFHYMVAAAGGDAIEVAPYKTFGTPELADAAAAALAERNACLLEHHGVLALGKTLEKALALAAEVENLARQYVLVRGLGEPRLIESDEMRRVIEKFRTYGMQPAEGDAAVIPAKPQEPSPPERWCTASGATVACTEKVKVLSENWEEARSMMTDMFEDAVLLGVSKASFQQAMHALVDSLECAYEEKKE